ncbi:MAG: CUB domain-containing protein, partial [Bacteroidales bacterium]
RLAGIGIWALGYDNGHPELWQAISDKFSDCYVPLLYDTLFDSGGPTWNYYANEHYTMTIDHGWQDTRYLNFISFHLEEPYDSLWVYAGPDTLSPLLGSYTGAAGPGSLSSPSGIFTLRFKSDPVQQKPGWMAVFHDGSLGLIAFSPPVTVRGLAYPNPALDKVHIRLEGNKAWSGYALYDSRGRMIMRKELPAQMEEPGIVEIDLAGIPCGLYYLAFYDSGGYGCIVRFIRR